MFPGDRSNNWPSFSESVPTSKFDFGDGILEWLTQVLRTVESSIPLNPKSILDQLEQADYARAQRFQTIAVEIYFGSDFFVSGGHRSTGRD